MERSTKGEPSDPNPTVEGFPASTKTVSNRCERVVMRSYFLTRDRRCYLNNFDIIKF